MPQLNQEQRKEYNKQYYLKNKEKNKCDHNRIKSYCKECGGASICDHKREKSKCKECSGGSICDHNRIKSQCKECGGASICDHNRIKSQCKECGGGSICQHNRRKSQCKECGGGSICDHKRIRSKCKECGGGSICIHNKQKIYCKDCNPLFCFINLQRSNISRIMKQITIDKTKPSIEYLGCSAEYFRDYIKSKMTEDMTFENIHYDHIKPVSVFNLEEENELLDCCHYTNFQPLLAKENLRKSCKWNDEDEVFWKENIRGQEYLPLYFPKG